MTKRLCFKLRIFGLFFYFNILLKIQTDVPLDEHRPKNPKNKKSL